MSSKEKKSWTKPAHVKFESAHDAIAYYSERGMSEHVTAIKKMSAERGKLSDDFQATEPSFDNKPKVR